MMEYKGYIGNVEFDDVANIFHGEVNRSIRLDWRFPDIVITKGSDTKWYYTTLHFCPAFDT